MKRTILLGTLTAALLAPFAVAQAQSNVIISVSTPEFGIRIGGPVFHPVPVYAPRPGLRARAGLRSSARPRATPASMSHRA